MTKEELTVLREQLIQLRNDCLGSEFDPEGAILLSHTIKWLFCKINNTIFKFED